MTTIGIIEGAAEAMAAITKVFSGTLSDYLGRRKLLVAIGYGLAAATKPIFPLAASVSWVFGARFVDPDRQGHPRRTPRCTRRGPHVPRSARGSADVASLSVTS